MTEPRRSLLEFVLVGAIGTVVAFAANAANPQGLNPSRNHFPKLGPPPAGGGGVTTSQTTTPSSVPATSEAQDDQVERRLRSDGIRILHDADALAAFRNPARNEGRIVFIDARDEQEYVKGHIPGAYRLYQGDLDACKDEVFPVAMAATEMVIVYCNGGECDDSIFTATELLNNGIVDKRLLSVYVNGFKRWKESNHPVEEGARNSGQITEGGK